MKKMGLLAAAAMLALSLPASAGEDMHLGEQMYDFTVDTIDGGSFTLSEALEEYDMVLINLWATWCGPCEMEFPYMEAAWEDVQDQVAVIALSVEENDTPEILAEYAEEHGMHFFVGRDTAGLDEYFMVTGIPTSIAVDRFGSICWEEVGAVTSKETFTALFETFIGDDYEESVILRETPAAKPSVEPADEAGLAEALNAEGGGIRFFNDEDESVWPMIPVETDGRLAVTTTNNGHLETTSVLLAEVAAEKGDALAFDYKSTLAVAEDLFTVYVDGEKAKAFTGEADWSSYAVALEAGEHEIRFTCEIYCDDDTEENGFILDEVRLLSGDEAEEALAANPVYPRQEEAYLEVLNEDAVEIVFDDPTDFLYENTLASRFFILNGLRAELEVGIPEEMDPETAFLVNDISGKPEQVVSLLSEDGKYTASSVIDSIANTDYSYTDFWLYPSIDATEDEIIGVMLFADEENLEDFIDMLSDYVALTWSVKGEEEDESREADTAGETAYRIFFTDGQGNPVEGVIVNFCTDEVCVPVTSDADGIAEFTGDADEYHLQVIKVPEGSEFDRSQEFTIGPDEPELTLTIE